MTLRITKLCHYVECHCAECRNLFIGILNVVMLSVVRLNVIMLSVVVPCHCSFECKMFVDITPLTLFSIQNNNLDLFLLKTEKCFMNFRALLCIMMGVLKNSQEINKNKILPKIVDFVARGRIKLSWGQCNNIFTSVILWQNMLC